MRETKLQLAQSVLGNKLDYISHLCSSYTKLYYTANYPMDQATPDRIKEEVGQAEKNLERVEYLIYKNLPYNISVLFHPSYPDKIQFTTPKIQQGTIVWVYFRIDGFTGQVIEE